MIVLLILEVTRMILCRLRDLEKHFLRSHQVHHGQSIICPLNEILLRDGERSYITHLKYSEHRSCTECRTICCLIPQ